MRIPIVLVFTVHHRLCLQSAKPSRCRPSSGSRLRDCPAIFAVVLRNNIKVLAMKGRR